MNAPALWCQDCATKICPLWWFEAVPGLAGHLMVRHSCGDGLVIKEIWGYATEAERRRELGGE